MKGIGYDYRPMNKKVKVPTKKFISPEKKTEFQMKDHTSQHLAQHVYPHNRGNKKLSRRNYHCRIYGHTSPFCYRLYGYPYSYSQPWVYMKKGKKTQEKKVWKPKEISTC